MKGGTTLRNLADLMDCASRKACNTNNLLYRSAVFKEGKHPSFLCDADSSVAHDASLGSGVGGLRRAMQHRFTKWGTVSQLCKRVSEYIERTYVLYVLGTVRSTSVRYQSSSLKSFSHITPHRRCFSRPGQTSVRVPHTTFTQRCLLAKCVHPRSAALATSLRACAPASRSSEADRSIRRGKDDGKSSDGATAPTRNVWERLWYSPVGLKTVHFWYGHLLWLD